MKRLTLIIADTDEAYVDGLCSFLGKNQSMRFDVKGFTGEEQLSRYLSGVNSNIDILLINPELNYQGLPLDRVYTLIFLGDGAKAGEEPQGYSINKYQHGDRLVGEIVEQYAKCCSTQICPAGGNAKTEVVCIFSPIGGSGKTSIAAGLSQCCAQKGKTVFYLNLEDIASTPMFFNFEVSKGFSNVLYYLREKGGNLAAKIEGCWSIDPAYGVYLFAPPENSSELYEAEPEELQMLIQLLKATGRFDYVFIDLPSSFDRRALAVLEESDAILVVALSDSVSETKLRLYAKELDVVSKKRSIVLQDKMNVILNRMKDSSGFDTTLFDIFGRTALVKILEDEMLHSPMGMRNLTDVNSLFYAGINRLAGIICKSSD